MGCGFTMFHEIVIDISPKYSDINMLPYLYMRDINGADI